MPTLNEAIAAYTGSSPFAQGIQAADYSPLIRAYGQGEPFTFLKGVPVGSPRDVTASEENGRVYIAQSLDSAVRVFVYDTKKEEQGGEFGVLPVGTTMLTCMPADLWPVRGDRFILTGRLDRARVLVTRADSGGIDVIAHSPLVSVVEIRNGATLYAPTTNYTVAGQNITWVAGAPVAGVRYSVELSYRPTYEYYPLSEQMPRMGTDGAYLPLRGMLTRVQLTGERP